MEDSGENSNSSLLVKPLQEEVSDFFDATQTHTRDSEFLSETLNETHLVSRKAGDPSFMTSGRAHPRDSTSAEGNRTKGRDRMRGACLHL